MLRLLFWTFPRKKTHVLYPSQSGDIRMTFSPKRHINLTQIINYNVLICAQPLGAPRPLALALLTVALPLAKPTPLPFTPLLLNIGAFLYSHGTLALVLRIPKTHNI